MADMQAYEDQLERAIEAYGAYLEESELPGLKELYRTMKSSFDAVHTLLQKKSLLKQDPYNYEEHITEIDIPADDDFLESEQDSVLSVRLTKYAARLDYLVNYFQISLDNFSLVRLKTLVRFNKYINWRNLTETSSQPTTRGIANLLAKIKTQHDQLSVNIVTDAREQLNNLARQVATALKKITTYRRETYKLALRREIMPHLSDLNVDSEQFARKSKGLIARAMPGEPYVRELILEVVSENGNDAEAQAARESILTALKVPDAPVAEEKVVSLKPLLLDSARGFAACGTALEHAMKKLADNVIVLDARKVSFGEMLKQIWQRLRGADDAARTFEIEYLDPETTARQREQIGYDDFRAAVLRRARIYSALIARSGPQWKKIEMSSEESLLDFLTRETTDLQTLARRLEAIETFMKAEITREQRSRLSSFSTEIESVRDALSRGKKKLHAYVSKHDEIEQLKRLGITPTS